jgi:site-specific recombinase XerD
MSAVASEIGRDRELLTSIRCVAPVVRRIDAADCADGLADELVRWGVYLRVVRGLAEFSVKNYLVCVLEFLGWLSASGLSLADVSAETVERWQKSLYLDRRLKAATRLQALSAVRGWFAWRCERAGVVSPLAGVRGPKRDRHVPRKFRHDELKAMFRSCNLDTSIGQRDLAMLVIFYATGMRRYEMATLALDQIELQERVGRVRIRGKGAKERVVSFEGPAVGALSSWLHERDRLGPVDNAVWLSMSRESKGSALGERGIELVVGRAKERAKIRADGKAVHALRVTFATDLYDEGVDLERIRILMGHESIETTRRYIAVSERQHRTRVSGQRLHDLLGTRNAGMPLWAKHKQEQWQKKRG